MPINLTYREVRDLAKNLRDLTGREFKHTQILDAIAKAVGRPADALMHELKNEGLPETLAPTSLVSAPAIPIDAATIAELMGFVSSPNGRRGSWTMRVLESRDPSRADLDIVIEPVSDLRWLPVIDPAEPLWMAKVVYTAIARNGDRTASIIASAGKDGLRLQSAINLAYEFASSRAYFWGKADTPWEPEYDLPELNPVAAAQLRIREAPVDRGSTYERARSLGFDVMVDDKGRRYLIDHGATASNGFQYRLIIDNVEIDGLAAPAARRVWGVLLQPTNRDGSPGKRIEMAGGLLLAEACDTVERIRSDAKAYGDQFAQAAMSIQRYEESRMTPADSRRMAAEADFLLQDTGGGSLAFVKPLRGDIENVGFHDPNGALQIGIATEAAVIAPPDEPLWYVAMEYYSAMSSHLARYEEKLTLTEAIAHAAAYEAEADAVWDEHHDPEAIAQYRAERDRVPGM